MKYLNLLALLIVANAMLSTLLGLTIVFGIFVIVKAVWSA